MSDPDRPIPTGGPWTRHGHPIPGVTVAGGRPPAVARCGGPALCRKCREDVAQAGDGLLVAPDRPTREQVDVALRRADELSDWSAKTDRAVLSAEVRALRAELDSTRIGLDVETRRADDWQRVANGMAEDAARAALVARTPRPDGPGPNQDHLRASGTAAVLTVWQTRTRVTAPHVAYRLDVDPRCLTLSWALGAMPRPTVEHRPECGCGDLTGRLGVGRPAPLPAVPDGEDVPRLPKIDEALSDCPCCITSAATCALVAGCCDQCAEIGRLKMHAAAAPGGEDAPDLLGALQRSLVDAKRKRATDAGEDVPARLDAAAETDRKIATVELRGLTACRCEAAWRDRGLHEPMHGCVSEYREAVDLLAALARPTGDVR